MLIRVRSLLLLALLVSASPAHAADEALLTVAEKSDFKATSRHADVVAFCEQLAKQSPLVRLGELGTTHEGRKLPLVIIADPPVATTEQARQSGKLVILAIGNIHAGEVDGKEALLMLMRDLVTAQDRPLLRNLILVFAPIFNADGNERIGRNNRPGQVGPEEGSGIRANAQGFDLNRDFVKLESPEVRSLVRFFTAWDPALFIDCHTTNGSYHRYTITYEGGRSLAGDPRLVAFLRDTMLPEVTERLEKLTKFKSYFYGNFSPDRKTWTTVPATPRYGIHYVGLRNRLAILSESYSYATYKDRILATQGFVRSIFESVNDHHDRIRKLLADVRIGPSTELVLQEKAIPLPRPQKILGWVEEKKGNRRVPTDKPQDYEALYYGMSEPLVKVAKPSTYLYAAALTTVTETLKRHGIVIEELSQAVDLDVQTYRVDKITRQREFQKHQPVSIEVSARTERRKLPAKSIVVRTTQPLGNLAAYLLEPQATDGLCTWNLFDGELMEGGDFPVVRVATVVELPLRPAP